MRRNSFVLPGIVSVLILFFCGCTHKPQDIGPDPGPGPDTTICDTSKVTYPGTVYPILSQYCIFCHSGANPTGGLDFTIYDQFASVAANGTVIGVIKHLPGYKPMPQFSNQLDSCRIRQIEIWIRDTTFLAPPEIPPDYVQKQ